MLPSIYSNPEKKKNKHWLVECSNLERGILHTGQNITFTYMLIFSENDKEKIIFG